MGAVTKQSTLAATEDEWQRRATAAAIEAARQIAAGGTIPPGTPVGRLSDSEWGWLFAAALFAWITTRAQQAVAEGSDIEATIRNTRLDPDPWDTGTVATILPELATLDIDWNKPLAAWPKEAMIAFLLHAFNFIRRAVAARDLGGGVTQEKGPDRIAREANAGAGNPLAVPSELNDPIPFDQGEERRFGYTVFDPQNGVVKARSIASEKLTSFLIEWGPPEREPDSDLIWLKAQFNTPRCLAQSFVTTDQEFDAWVARGKPLHDLPRSALRNEDGSPAQGNH